MSTYEIQAIMEASTESISNVFLTSIKKDFPNFNEEKAVGSTIKKTVGAYKLAPMSRTFEKNPNY